MEDNRKKIIDATAELVKEVGFENVTVQAICKKAYIARSTFYYQFHSLDEVLRQCFKLNYVIDETVTKKIESFSNPLDKLFYFHITYLNQVIQFGVDHARYQQLNNLKHTPENMQIGFLTTSNSIIPYIREAQELNLILNKTKPEILCQAITKCMFGSQFYWIHANGSYDLITDTLNSVSGIYQIDSNYSWKHLLR